MAFFTNAFLTATKTTLLFSVNAGTRFRTFRSQIRASNEKPSSNPKNEDELTRMLQETKKLMQEVENQTKNERVKPIAAPLSTIARRQPEMPPLTLNCDVSGCTIAPVLEVDDNEGDELTQKDVHVLQGKGWKLGIDQKQKSSQFCGFIGGDDWSISLTKEEYEDFVVLVKSLRQGVATLEVCGDWGTEESEATLEMNTSRIWMQGRATQKRLTLLSRLWSRKSFDEGEQPKIAFSLRFLVKTENTREAEGQWNADVVMEVLQALEAKSPDAAASGVRKMGSV